MVRFKVFVKWDQFIDGWLGIRMGVAPVGPWLHMIGYA